MPRTVQAHRSRYNRERHAGFRWSAVCFLRVALPAAGDQVLPKGQTAARLRNHVIQRQPQAWKALLAVLAHVPVANKDVPSRYSMPAYRHAAILAAG